MHSVRRVVVVSALGYFVDVLDLFLFNVVRQPSLRDLGVTSADSMLWGLRLLNAQMIGVLIGARLTAFIPSEHMMLVLSAVLIILSLVFLFAPDHRVEATTLNASMGGAASGFVAGLVGTGGAIRGLTLAAFDLPKEVFISTSAWIDMGVDLSRTVVYAQQGFIAQSTWAYLPWLAAISLLGSWAGRWLLARVPQERFRKLVLVLVIAVAVFSAVRAAMEIVR